MNKIKVSEDDIIELLEEIQSYMLDNDLECGERGREIYNQISKILGEEE